ncbi:hypothetical protein EG329_006426 [Mollisiaceae sp. DMI_Dod_QoI]|nr:hypothetical protein EG329_006426 [Helotiales sp. DMI_Dod_QoI]
MSKKAANGSTLSRKSKSNPLSLDWGLSVPKYSPTQAYLDNTQSYEAMAVGYGTRSCSKAIQDHEERIKRQIEALASI